MAGRAETGSSRQGGAGDLSDKGCGSGEGPVSWPGGAGDLTREISHSYVFKFQPAGMLACEI